MFTIGSNDTARSLFEIRATATAVTRGGGGSGVENDSCIGTCGVDGTDGEIIVILIAGVGCSCCDAMAWRGR